MAETRKTTVKKPSVVNLQRGGITPRRIVNGPLEWYELTEQTKYVLNNRLSSSLKLRLAEERSGYPDPKTIENLNDDIHEIMRIKSSPNSFRSLKTMKNILERYA